MHKSLISYGFDLSSAAEVGIFFYQFLFKKPTPLPPKLVGPFKILNKTINFENKIDALLYHRCYHDSPEFLTFAVNDKNPEIRLCFYRLFPKMQPVIVKVERNQEKKDSKILPNYTHICDSVEIKSCFELATKKGSSTSNSNPWHKKITTKHEIISNSKTIDTVCDTITNLGIHVPMKGDVGYRDLQITNKKLIKNFTQIHNSTNDQIRKDKFKPLLEINNNIQYANDECDFGMCYEFGFDLFHFGSFYLNKFCLRTLPLAYQLLGWDEWKELIEKHMADRRDELEVDGFFA